MNDHSRPYHNDTTQGERRTIVRAEVRAAKAERVHSSYFAHAVADADLAAGGRFVKVNAVKVTGVPAVPALPASSPFASDPVPPEPQLGVDVNAMEPVGTEAEIAQSVASSFPPPMRAPTSSAPDNLQSVETDVGARSIRRRAR
jgi:hypothetical protein